MTANITPTMSKLNIQREVIQKLKSQKSTKIPKKLMNKIETFSNAYAQVKANTSSVSVKGTQAYKYIGNPKLVSITAVDKNSESQIMKFTGIDSVVTFGNSVIKELGEIK